MKNSKKGHGIALFSSGLDSTLAILLILRQEIEVTALTFMTHFGCNLYDSSSCVQDPTSLANRFGFAVKMMHLGHEFIEIVRNPKHGHGKNMNPCIDCRILMLKEAKKYMEMVQADFVFTGEVVGQRPMSQHKPQLNLIAKEADLAGRLVRPLSARILPETEPEKSGLLDRMKLENISGRSRKRQLEMAERFNLEDYPTPAAGCLLTDRGYSKRLRDLFAHQENVDFDDLNLLRVGRHFRIGDKTKLIVGRNEEENEKILKYRKSGDYILEARDTGSPLTLIKGTTNEMTIKMAAAITARYCDLKRADTVEVSCFSNDSESRTIMTSPEKDDYLDKIRI